MFKVWGSRLAVLVVPIALGLALFASAANADTVCDTDYNGDGVTNDADAEIFQSALGSQEGDENYFEQADHDANGVITATDFAVFLSCR